MGDWEVVNTAQSQKASPAASGSSDWEVVSQDQPQSQAPTLSSAGLAAGGSSNESSANIGLGQAANLGAIRTPEYKVKYLQQALNNPNVSVAEDGRIKVMDKNGNDSYIEPHRNGVLNWLKDTGTKLAEFAGEQGAPLIGQIGADMAVAGAAPESGGASLLGMGAANAAGAAAGTGARQAYANQLIGEPFSGPDMAGQALAGGASVPIGAAMGAASKGASRYMGKMLGKTAVALGDSFPSVAEALIGVNPNASEWLINQMKPVSAGGAGRLATDILDPNKADSSVGGKIVRRLLFGDADAAPSSDLFLKQYQRLIKPIAQDAGRVSTIDTFISKTLGLSQDTLDVLKKRPAAELLDPLMTDPRAWINMADQATGSIKFAEKTLQDKYAPVKKAFVDLNKDRSMNISDLVDNLLNESKKLGVVETINGINQIDRKGYSGEAGKKAYGFIMDKLGVTMPKMEAGRTRSGFSAKAIQYLTDKQSSGAMKVSDILEFKAKTKPLFNRLFEGTGLSAEEKRPIAQFISDLNERIYALPGSKPIQEMNARYGKLEQAMEYFTSLKEGGISEQQGVIGGLKKALSNDPQIRDTAQSFIKDLDNQLPKNKILPRLQTLGAAQDIKYAKYGDSATSLIGQMKSIQQTGTNPDMQREAANILKTVDNAIHQRAFKFYDDMRDHLTAEAFSSHKANFLRVRALLSVLGPITGAALITKGHPLAGSLAVLGGMSAFSPAGLGATIRGGSRLYGQAQNMMSGAGAAMGNAANNQMSQSAQRALIASLLKKASTS